MADDSEGSEDEDGQEWATTSGGPPTLLSIGAAMDHITVHPADRAGRRMAMSVLMPGVSVNVHVGRFFQTPLYTAAEVGSVALAQRVLHLGGVPTIVGELQGGHTPLHAAARRGDVEMVALLLAAGASVNATAYDGSTPGHTVCRSTWPDMGPTLSTLVAAGMDVNAVDCEGCTPLFCAVAPRRDPAVLAQLLSLPRLDLGWRNRWGRTAVQAASVSLHEPGPSVLAAIANTEAEVRAGVGLPMSGVAVAPWQ